MAFTLEQVVPWGRSFDEYVTMFALSDADLGGRILGCGDGPASFNAVASARGHAVVSADPLYRFSGPEIQARIDAASGRIADETRRNVADFVWTRFASVDDLLAARLEAMRVFLGDLDAGRAAGRYLDASLPDLPFPDQSFDLALCSHFLFLYSDQYPAEFHVEAITELGRVSNEVRVFPLLEMGGAPSRHIDQVVVALGRRGFSAERVRVPYEFQRGGNEMLRIT
jgi:hypothetical protein